MSVHCENCGEAVTEPREFDKKDNKWKCRDCYPTAFTYFYSPDPRKNNIL